MGGGIFCRASQEFFINLLSEYIIYTHTQFLDFEEFAGLRGNF